MMTIEIIRNENGVYLFHKNGSKKDRLECLKKIITNISNNAEYSSIEKQLILKKAIYDYTSFSLISEA